MTAPNARERIVPRLIEDELKESFLDYSMSVIVQRALPDVMCATDSSPCIAASCTP